MSQHGFSLIELLVVVAIIGILAAVGVVAYQGYTESAAIAATKANHKTAIDFTTATFMKCAMGGDVGVTPSPGVRMKYYDGTGIVRGCHDTSANWLIYMTQHFNGSGFKNPHNPKVEQFTDKGSANPSTPGQTIVSRECVRHTGKFICEITFTTCFQKGCQTRFFAGGGKRFPLDGTSAHDRVVCETCPI